LSGQRLSLGLASASADHTLALADAAEREGVGGVWIGGLDGSHDAQGDSYRTMVAAAVAARTDFVRIGCVLTLADADSTLRLAEDVAMIDEASAGRLELLLALGGDSEREERAVRLLSAWRGWEVSDGRRFPVTPRPAQPALPRLVVSPSFDSPAAARLAAGVLVPAEGLAASALSPPPPRTSLERRVLAFGVHSARDFIADGAAGAVWEIRKAADGWEADEVAVWLGPTKAAEISSEVRILTLVLGAGVAGGEAAWEMLAELGARAAGAGGRV
jgi:alkanesulfonate monooxygenase SsuD/methylene tetrahydromethanopterin reductase-like flavin-dependent oxidoreductase (luciferase family)